VLKSEAADHLRPWLVAVRPAGNPVAITRGAASQADVSTNFATRAYVFDVMDATALLVFIPFGAIETIRVFRE
jgi:hypothetical protein